MPLILDHVAYEITVILDALHCIQINITTILQTTSI